MNRFVVLLVSVCALVARAESFRLAGGGKALAEIVIDAQATRSARFGALELQAHLKAMTGADFAIVTPTNRTVGMKPVYVGESAPERKLAPAVETLARQELLVFVRPDAIVLAGRDEPDFCTNRVPHVDYHTLSSFDSIGGFPSRWSAHGTLDAVYEFLENDCGVRWFDSSDDGTEYVEDPSLSVPAGDRRVSPFVYCRNISMDGELWRRNTEGWDRERVVAYPNAYRPNRWTEAVINTQRDIFRLRRRVAGENETCNHSLANWYERFLNTNSVSFVAYHPEYFAQGAKGQDKCKVFIEAAYDPKKRPPQLCYTNPDVIRQVIVDIRDYFDHGGLPVYNKRGEVVRYDPKWGVDSCALEPMDNDGFCECARCRAEYPSFVTNTSHWIGTTRNDHWFGFVNKVAREVKKTHPAKRISTLAYMSHTAPPSFRMEDNVVVHFCHHGNRMPQAEKMNERLAAQLRDWATVLKPGNLGLWFYNCFPHEGASGTEGDFMCFPGNFLDRHYCQYQDLVKPCQARSAIFYCGCTGELENYAVSRWFWNPDETPEKIKESWFGAYGAAGPAIREFYEIIEERFNDPAYYPEKKTHQNDLTAWRYLGTPEVDAKLEACAKRAMSATGLTDRQRARRERWFLGTRMYVKSGPRLQFPCKSGRPNVAASRTLYKYRPPEPFGEDVLSGAEVVSCVLKDDRTVSRILARTKIPTNGIVTNNVAVSFSKTESTNGLLAVVKPIRGLSRFRVTVNRGDSLRARSAFAPVGLVDGKWVDLAGEQLITKWIGSQPENYDVFEFSFMPGSAPDRLAGIGVRDFSHAVNQIPTRFALLEAECAAAGEGLGEKDVTVDYLAWGANRVFVKVDVPGAEVLEPIGGIHFIARPTFWKPRQQTFYPIRVRARMPSGKEYVTAVRIGLANEKTKAGPALRIVRPGRKMPLRFTVFNCECVNQAPGQCVAIETPEGKVFAFDTANGNLGDEKNPKCRSNGKDILVPFLRARGYDRLDGLIISHAHIDHFGGFNWLKYNWPVSRLWDNGFTLPGTDPKDYRGELGTYARLRDEFAAEHPGAYQVVHAGMKLDWGKGLDVEVIWPPKGGVALLKDRANPKEDTPVHHLVNANSVAVRITYGDVSFLIAGDIQEDYFERSMAKQVPPEKMKCDVCVLPAHGIHTTELEASLTRPKLALVGIGNRTYMYETPKVSRRIYEAVGSKVYVSNEVGDITVTTDGKRLDVSTNGRLYPKLTK